MKPIIIALEDSTARILWLRSEFEDRAEIIWADSVEKFFDRLRKVDHSRLKLILLDHDLGGAPISPTEPELGTSIETPNWPLDEDGQNGTHAVARLDGYSDIPTIVWSINTVAGPRMKHDLKQKGFVTEWIPFFNRASLRTVIDQLISV